MSSAAGRRIAKIILENASDILKSPLIELECEFGRDVILPTSRALMDRVAALAIADCLEGGTLHRKRLIEELLQAADFADWNPAHFLDTAEMTMGMSLGLCWTRSLLSRSLAEKLAKEIVKKGINPGLKAAEAGATWMAAENNWNIVCCGGMIAGAAAIRDFESGISEAALECFLPAIQCGLSAFGDDGSYTESPDYWEYAVRYAVLAHAVMRDIAVAGDAPASLIRTWRYGRDLTGPSKRVFNFGDGTEQPRRLPVIGWLANASGEVEAGTWQHFAPGAPHPFDLIWLAPAADHPGGDDILAAYEPAGIAVLRKGSTWLALKGGRNDVNHAHLDIGTFVFEMSGHRFVSELGREDYALPGYFDPDLRFGYFRTRTQAHSTLLFNDTQQPTTAYARPIGSGRTETTRFVAYEIHDDPNRSWIRAAAMDEDSGVFIVDELETSEDGHALRATWQLYTEATGVVDGARVALFVEDAVAEFTILEPKGLNWSLEPAPCPIGQSPNSQSRLFFQFAVPAGHTRIVVKICAPGSNLPLLEDLNRPIAQWPFTAQAKLQYCSTCV